MYYDKVFIRRDLKAYFMDLLDDTEGRRGIVVKLGNEDDAIKFAKLMGVPYGFVKPDLNMLIYFISKEGKNEKGEYEKAQTFLQKSLALAKEVDATEGSFNSTYSKCIDYVGS